MGKLDKNATSKAKSMKPTTQNKSGSLLSEEAKQTQQNAYNDVKDVITAPFDFMKWCVDNWQLVVIAGAAIFVLIKD